MDKSEEKPKIEQGIYSISNAEIYANEIYEEVKNMCTAIGTVGIEGTTLALPIAVECLDLAERVKNAVWHTAYEYAYSTARAIFDALKGRFANKYEYRRCLQRAENDVLIGAFIYDNKLICIYEHEGDVVADPIEVEER